MKFALIPLDLINEEDKEKRRAYLHSRNLYNKYTLVELKNWEKIDLYEALDLDEFRYISIPTNVLKHVVKKKSTMYHPLNSNDLSEAFLLIKKAEEILSVPKYRKLYDSVFLDESIPDDKEYAIEEFYSSFGPVFIRNGQFSEAQPVPAIKDSPDVFYKFWSNFKTTRVYDDPADVIDQRGSSRKYYADKNKDAIQKKKCSDMHRIQDLVKLAYRRDPRIQRSKPVSTGVWNEEELKTLTKFNILFGKSKNKYADIATKLNNLYVTKRSQSEVKLKLESLKKK
ncbi:DnaJ-like protein subfamily C member 2 [Enteropsectra breve]|nr:DnaJ-like protein subfamily C member 2 [Enteropsectra breve]